MRKKKARKTERIGDSSLNEPLDRAKVNKPSAENDARITEHQPKNISISELDELVRLKRARKHNQLH